jgi:endoribonuclease Dicer
LIWEYASPTEEPNFPSPTIYQCLQIIDTAVWDQLDILWSNIETRYHMTLANLGPYSASLFLYSEIQRSLETLLAQNRAQLLHDDGEFDAEGVAHPGLVAKKLPEDIHLIIDILHDFDLLFDAQDIIVDLDWCTPKVAALVDILLHYYTSAFQGIIFVQQRQVAFALSRILESTPRLEGKIRCAFLVGQGVDAQGLQNRYQGESRFSNPVKAFRDGKVNIRQSPHFVARLTPFNYWIVVIATSVAEEGLDFPACDLVVRFDPLHHMIAYVQSRGRARNKASTFVLMVQEDNVAQIQTFVKLQQKEPELNQVYQTRHLGMDIEEKLDEDDDDDTSVIDLAKRERYVVPSTGAILTYDNSMNLLNYLCSLIPRDAFTPSHAPKYGGDFHATLQLPRALPLLPDDLLYAGPLRQSKKEARRAVSFMAVKRLQELDVFDEYLLPTAKYGDEEEDDTHVRGGFTNAHSRVERLPVISTTVKDPWYIGTKLWLHPILVSGETAAGLVTGTPLRMDNIMIEGNQVTLLPPKLLFFDCDVEHQQRTDMIEFTKRGIWFNNSSRPLPSSLGFYIIPLTPDHQPDFSAMHLLLDNIFGIKDWSQITENDYGKLMIMNLNRIGSMLLLQSVRHDLKPTSQPSFGSREAAYPTYLDYWMYKWSKKTHPATIPSAGPLLEATNLPRSFMYVHHWNENLQVVQSVSNGALLPQSSCSWIPISYTVQQVFRILPTLARHLTDYYRAQCARADLGLPHISTNLLIEALTIPATILPYDNQRLETLGDAVLQVCATVHLLNKYPNRHEGQLTTLRKLIVSNRYLRLRALDAGLQHYINSEVGSVNKWRYVLPKQAVPYDDTAGPPSRCVEREYATRSLQDCMEALLGASYLAGGIPFALQTGAALGLQFGGVIPWNERYSHEYFESDSHIGTLFAKLENNLGYRFRRNDLLVQALTHPSFASNSPSYQRLEFLGDGTSSLRLDQACRLTTTLCSHP